MRWWSSDECTSTVLTEWGEATCTLPAGHHGPHVDGWEGWQW